MSKRTPEQQAALDQIYDADQKLRQAKRLAESEVRLQVEARVIMQKTIRDDLVMEGLARGLSKGVIGRQGLSTTDPAAVNKILTVKAPHLVEGDSYVVGPFSWVERATGVVKVNYVGYAADFADETWNSVLNGVIQKDDKSPSGWVVLVDASDRQTDFGRLDGFLRVTLGAAESPLLTELDGWAVS